MHPTAPKRRGILAQFAHGFSLAGRGFGMWVRRPKLMLLGAIPALITLLLFGAGFVALLWNIGDLSAWITAFADDWATGWRTTMRVLAGVSIVGLSGLLTVLLYTSVTLIVGDPFYEAISGEVEKMCGGVRNEIEVGFWRGIGKAVVEALRLLVRTSIVGLLLFALGFIPLFGQFVVPVIGVLVTAWFFTIGIVAVAFSRRGVDYPERRKLLGGNRSLSVGFGTGFVLLFFVPGGAILATPAAVAGGTLLARELFGESTELVRAGAPGRPGSGYPVAPGSAHPQVSGQYGGQVPGYPQAYPHPQSAQAGGHPSVPQSPGSGGHPSIQQGPRPSDIYPPQG